MIRLKEKTDPEPVDVLTVCEQLSTEGELEEAGGTAYVHSLPTIVPAAGNVRHYAKIVKDHALMRRLLSTTRDIQDEVFSFQGPVRELLEQAESAPLPHRARGPHGRAALDRRRPARRARQARACLARGHVDDRHAVRASRTSTS